MGKDPGCQIAEVAARHREDRRTTIPLFKGKEVIELLRKPSGDIDRISARDPGFLIQIGVCQSLLCQRLAVVKVSTHFKSRNVSIQRRKLQFLYLANFSLWIEDHDLDAIDAVKTGRHSSTRVARGGNHHDSFSI